MIIRLQNQGKEMVYSIKKLHKPYFHRIRSFPALPNANDYARFIIFAREVFFFQYHNLDVIIKITIVKNYIKII